MLPILLFNNMEGGSNSMNNIPGSSYSGIYDENVILNCVRSRKKVTELPNCPVCSCTIRQGELESHLGIEVDRLTKLSFGSKRKLSATSSPLPIAGSSTSLEQRDDQEIDVSGCPGSDVYNRARQNRLQRLRARRRATPPPPQPTHGDCPVCNTTLPWVRLQKHALRCLKKTGAAIDEDVSDTSSDESIDVENDEPPATEGAESGGSFGAEYNWCGQWRIRAVALQEAPAEKRPARRTAWASRDSNETLVVDGDEDVELFGPPQYSPSRIAEDAIIDDPEETPDEEVSHNGGDSAQNGTEEEAEEQAMEQTEVETGQQLERETEEHTGEQSEEDGSTLSLSSQGKEEGRPKINGVVAASAETRIQALKARIRELETKQKTEEQKCLICLGAYVSPAVSIQCWHVYCEVCWLQSLKSKKICPHCSTITSTQHLRRIYM